MALRWGKTEGAYNKYKWIFSKTLPLILKSDKPLSESTYVRDVISFANEKSLPGQNWYKKVIVSAEDNAVVIRSRNASIVDIYKDIPAQTLFDIIKKFQDAEMPEVFKCVYSGDASELKRVASEFGFEIEEKGNSILEFRRNN